MFHSLAVSVYKLLPRKVSSLGIRMLKQTWPIGVVAIVVDDSNRLLLLEHRYHKPAWRLPGGLMDKGESPVETAVREVREEANCEIRPISVIDAAHTKYTFDVAVLARLHKQGMFTQNAEILSCCWSDMEKVLPQLGAVQRQFVESAIRFLRRT